MSNPDPRRYDMKATDTRFSSGTRSRPLLKTQRSSTRNLQRGNKINIQGQSKKSLEKGQAVVGQKLATGINDPEKSTMTEKSIMKAIFDDRLSRSKLKNKYIKPSKETDGQTKTGFTGNAIPWRKKDPTTNPWEERKILFDSFHRTGGDPPKSPPHLNEDYKIKSPAPSSSRRSQNSKQEKWITFKDEIDTESNVIQPYEHIDPKVDTGLKELKSQYNRYGISVSENPHKYHHPLTIGSQLPADFERNKTYEQFKAIRKAQIANVTERLYPRILKSRKAPPQQQENNTNSSVNFDPQSSTNGEQQELGQITERNPTSSSSRKQANFGYPTANHPIASYPYYKPPGQN